MTIPCSWDTINPADYCSTWNSYTQGQRDSALWLASTYLWAATGRRYGPCPVTVRPGQRQGEPLVYQDFPVTPGAQGVNVPGGPFLFAGRWFNSGCATACCGTRACAIVLRGPVAGVEEVLVDGAEVPADAYRVDVTGGAYLLVRTDGACWPVCQDMAADPSQLDTFEVTYLFGRVIPEALAIATGLLACEQAKFLASGACRLPAKMTRLSRQGVEVEVEPPAPADGLTGIREVDQVVAALNPSRRQSPPQILSPDLPENCDRVTVWNGVSS